MSMHTSYSGKTILDMTSVEFETACQRAVAARDDRGSVGFSAMWAEETGKVVMLYADEHGCFPPVIGEKG